MTLLALQAIYFSKKTYSCKRSDSGDLIAWIRLRQLAALQQNTIATRKAE
jgi:hypothetical protein